MKPKITRSVIIQFPDLGRLCNFCGKIASRVKGKEKANEKESIPKTGLICKPLADCTKILPTNGPVHENETKTSVKAMKKIPSNPPSWDFLSTEVIILEGIVSSKNPIRESPKTINNTKNIKFGIQDVAISFADCGPMIRDKKTPRKVNIKIIDKPKNIASK